MAGTSGLLEFNNTGLVITNVAACEYWHSNGNGTYIEYTGLPAFMIAVLDGYDNGSWEGHSGITGSNAITDPSEYCIAFAYASNLGYVGQTWGGIALTASDSNDLLIRETYMGDANLDGMVNIYDYDTLLANAGAAQPPRWSGRPPVILTIRAS